MAGAPSQKTATQFGQRMKASRTLPYAVGSIQEGATIEETKLLNSNLYPTRFVPSDDFDSEWMIRQQLVAQGSDMISAKRPMPWTEGEIDYLKRKRDAEEYAAYNDWLIHKFPLNDPANRDILKRTVPRYFSERKQVLEEQINLSAKYANLRLFGPENEDDLKLQYAVETGRVKLPQGPFHDPVQWMENEAVASGLPAGIANNAQFIENVGSMNRQTYEKGLFNPFSFLTWANAPWAPNALNMADSVGDPRVRALGPLGAQNPTNENYAHQYHGASLGNVNRTADWNQGVNRDTAAYRNTTAAMASGRRGEFELRANPANQRVNTPWLNPIRGFGGLFAGRAANNNGAGAIPAGNMVAIGYPAPNNNAPLINAPQYI